MKRTVPLLITFLAGLILIVAAFIPYTQNWKNDVVIWFDILAAIAFVLGGGNLLMMHLKKVSDRKAGWGYSAVTLIAFLTTLVLGTIKYGSPPEPQTERYGQTAAFLPLDDFPLSFEANGVLPDGDLPAVVRGQLAVDASKEEIIFRGWMTADQSLQLAKMEYEVGWQQTVEALSEKAQPPEILRGKIEYQGQLERMFFKGSMSGAERDALAGLGDGSRWNTAVETLYTVSNQEHSVPLDRLPPDYEIPDSLRGAVTFDSAQKELRIRGPMSRAQRDLLVDSFPAGPQLDEAQKRQLVSRLEELGPLAAPLKETIEGYNKPAKTAARRNHDLLFELLRVAKLHPGVSLNEPQREFLLEGYDVEIEWEIKVGDLFAASHQLKFPYSGQYNAEGSAIWYIYEYALQPLTATMFALLAFYVASAAFRAFRAKNAEAILLLGTAFVVLLGRTYLGTWLTGWMPASLSGLTIPELTVVIMSVFTTAGNRAIMIGIALGVVATSLKILLGVDRSYLGSDTE